jgi:hypothetical protein
MATTTGLVNGTLVALYKDVSGTPTKIANLTSTDFELSKDTIDATNKDGGELQRIFSRPFRLDYERRRNL